MVITKSVEKQLFMQGIGTGFLILKTAENELMQVEVFVSPRTGSLCRITDGKPVFPLTLTYDED